MNRLGISELSNNRLRMVSIYLLTTVVGVVLIAFAVYNASNELEIRHQIDNIYLYNTSRVQKYLQGATAAVNMDELVSSLTTNQYRAYAYSDSVVFKIDDNELMAADIEKTRISPSGGYLVNASGSYTWSLLSIDDGIQKILIIHIHQASSYIRLFSAYKNNLVIPLIFYIWMTIWGALILSKLIKEIQKQKDDAEHMALHDALTGLANRRLFSEKFEKLCQFSARHGHTFCVAVIDLNKFKQVNDTHGHETGDELLKQVASRFKKALRSYDLIARLGGDEFVLILPDSNHEDSLETYRRIHGFLIEPYTISGLQVAIGASMGVSYFPEHSADTAELMRMADSAMYLAKSRQSDVEVYGNNLDA